MGIYLSGLRLDFLIKLILTFITVYLILALLLSSGCSSLVTKKSTDIENGWQRYKEERQKSSQASTKTLNLLSLIMSTPNELAQILMSDNLAQEFWLQIVKSNIKPNANNVIFVRLFLFMFLFERDLLVLNLGEKIYHPIFEYPGMSNFLKNDLNYGIDLDQPLGSMIKDKIDNIEKKIIEQFHTFKLHHHQVNVEFFANLNSGTILQANENIYFED